MGSGCNGLPWGRRLPRIVAAIRALPVRSVILDGEAVCDLADGRNDFHALASAGGCREAHLIAFDLLGINGEDMRAKPLEARRSALADVLSNPPDGLALSE